MRHTLVFQYLLASVLFYLVVFEDWGMVGAAYGTIIAEYIGIAILLFNIRSKYKLKRIPLPQLRGLREFLRINSDLFIRTLALTLSFAFFYRQSSAQGAVILGVNVVLLQFLSWLSYGIDGFAHATEILIGNAKGRREPDAILATISSSFKLAVGMAIMYSALFLGFSVDISRVFSDDPVIISAVGHYRFWLSALPVIAIWCYIWDGVFIGLTQTKIMRDTMLLSLTLFITISISLEGNVSNPIWYALMAMLLVRGILLWGYWSMRKGVILEMTY